MWKVKMPQGPPPERKTDNKQLLRERELVSTRNEPLNGYPIKNIVNKKRNSFRSFSHERKIFKMSNINLIMEKN